VLDEVTPADHIEHLCATTDTEEGKFSLNCSSEEFVLEAVAIRARFISERVGNLTVFRRIYVFPATNDQAIETVKDGASDVCID
jgi:hypothetical protein